MYMDKGRCQPFSSDVETDCTERVPDLGKLPGMYSTLV